MGAPAFQADSTSPSLWETTLARVGNRNRAVQLEHRKIKGEWRQRPDHIGPQKC